MRITLKPIDSADNHVIEELNERLCLIFGCPVEITPKSGIPDKAFDPERGQYIAPALLDTIKTANTTKDEKALGIVDVDLYAPGLQFVFGEADAVSGIAIISLCRLRQEYYGLPSDDDLFLNRVTKEAVHELGHLSGLGHCSDVRCVMHFSNSLADTDKKESIFCSQCRPKLIK